MKIRVIGVPWSANETRLASARWWRMARDCTRRMCCDEPRRFAVRLLAPDIIGLGHGTTARWGNDFRRLHDWRRSRRGRFRCSVRGDRQGRRRSQRSVADPLQVAPVVVRALYEIFPGWTFAPSRAPGTATHGELVAVGTKSVRSADILAIDRSVDRRPPFAGGC